MKFKRELGAASMLAAAWYSGAAAAADYNTEIYSVAVDADDGTLLIDGVDLAPAGTPGGAHVQLLGKTLVIHEANSSNTHLEAALPDSVSLDPGTGYQLYVSPSRSRGTAGSSLTDQAFFTLYVTSKLSGARATTVSTGHGSGASGNASAASTGGGKSSIFFNSLGSAFSLNSHSTSSNISNGPTPNNGSTFSLPYTGSLGSTSTLFSLTNTGTGDAIDGISSSTAANSTAVLGMLSSTSPGANATAVRGANSGTNGNGIGVWGSHAGSGIGVNGTSVTGYGVRAAATGAGIGLLAYSGAGPGLYATSNTGQAGSFTITNTSSTSDVHRIVNQGLGRGLFINSLNANSTGAGLQVNVATAGSGESITNTNSSNTADTLYVTTNGPGVINGNSPTGNAGNFFINNTNGVGSAVRGETNSIFGNAGATAFHGVASGTGGTAAYLEHTNSSGFGLTLYGITYGQGMVGEFVTPSNAGGSNGNTQATVSIQQNANGAGLNIASASPTGSGTTPNTTNILNVSATGPGVIADHSQGNVANFFMNNTNGVGAAVRGETNSIFGNNGTAAIYGVASGTGGYGGYFEHSNASGFGVTLYGTTSGGGIVGEFVTPLGAGGTGSNDNSQPTVQIQQEANGSALAISSTSPTTSGYNPNTSNIVNVTFDGPGVIADHSQGNTANFVLNNTNSVGAGVRGEVNSQFGNGGAAGIYGVASGTGGYAGYFEHTDTTGFGIGVQIQTEDLGTALVVNQNGTSGDPAIFEAGGFNVARIDRTGKGFFNGGTQNSGADLAEFVPTIGATPQVGDVVEIDPEHPNSFRLCAEANTTRVAGIISTAPGVTLNAKNGAAEDVSGPALALAGRVPTKVNNRGGSIHIGDLLVASSEPGRAMRAPDAPRPGTVIGKALQDSDADEGTVEVLVMLR